jgi:hypothetical protein
MLGFFVFILIFGNILCLMADGAWLGTEDQDEMAALTGHEVQESGGIPIITPVVNFAQAFWHVVSWDFSFFEGGLQIIRWFLLTLTAIAVFAIAQEFRSTVTSIFGRR